MIELYLRSAAMDGRGWTGRNRLPSRNRNPVEAALMDERIRCTSVAMDGRCWTFWIRLPSHSGNLVEAAITDERIGLPLNPPPARGPGSGGVPARESAPGSA